MYRVPVLYLIACAAGPAQYLDDGVRLAPAAEWDVCLILTPSAASWWEPRMQELVDLTGHPVRSRYELPWESEAVHMGTPVVAMPYFNQAQGAQPAVAVSVERLRKQGVVVLDGRDGYTPHPPNQGHPRAFPWERALDRVKSMINP
ncbi:flavoprotein [Streptomyces sp. NPDC001904]|uniref:flavoprotein n=1 Tax=Streptomyces sp. NPDC001904 TaxID=3154531 RepID=UPI00331F4B97